MSQMKAQVDKLLTQASDKLKPKGFISELLLPRLQVAQYSGLLGAYGTDHLRIEHDIVGGQGMYPRVTTLATSTSSYNIEGHGLEDVVTKRDRANYDKPFNAERDKTVSLTMKLLVGKEKALADSLSDTAILTQNTTLSGTDQFSDYLNSDPLAKFSVAREAIRDGCGMYPNAAWMDKKVRNQLRYHPQLLDALGFKDNRPGGLSDAEIANILDVDRILIADAVYESAKEGQSSSIAAVWGKHVFMGHIPSNAQPEQISLGYNVVPSGSKPRKVYKYAINNPPDTTGLLVEDEYDMLLSKVAAAYLIKDAIA